MSNTLVKRLGGEVELFVDELDNTSKDTLMTGVNPDTGAFAFKVLSKD